jgi:hypothetical protein
LLHIPQQHPTNFFPIFHANDVLLSMVPSWNRIRRFIFVLVGVESLVNSWSCIWNERA